VNRLFYFSFLLLVACGNHEETIKETNLIIKEVKTTLQSKEDKANALFWQQAYLKLNIMLETYQHLDVDALKVAKEARDVFEAFYDFRKENDVSSENFIKLFAYTINSVAGNGGTTLSDSLDQTAKQQKELVNQIMMLNLHLEKLDVTLCNKYQLYCPTNPSDKSPQK